MVFGNSTLPLVLELSSLDGSNGFKINGEAASDFSGASVSTGDVNGDGIEDIIIGAYGVNSFSGSSYVVFGNSAALNPALSSSSASASTSSSAALSTAPSSTGLSSISSSSGVVSSSSTADSNSTSVPTSSSSSAPVSSSTGPTVASAANGVTPLFSAGRLATGMLIGYAL